MSFNYGEIHMFDSVKRDMEKKDGKPHKTVRIQEEPVSIPNITSTQQEPQPFSGRRHTIAHLWEPFSSGSSGNSNMGTSASSSPYVSSNPPPAAAAAGRRMSVMERMRQYMSPSPASDTQRSSNDVRSVQYSAPPLKPPPIYAHPFIPIFALPAHAIAICVMNTVSIAGSRQARMKVPLNSPITSK